MRRGVILLSLLSCLLIGTAAIPLKAPGVISVTGGVIGGGQAAPPAPPAHTAYVGVVLEFFTNANNSATRWYSRDGSYFLAADTAGTTPAYNTNWWTFDNSNDKFTNGFWNVLQTSSLPITVSYWVRVTDANAYVTLREAGNEWDGMMYLSAGRVKLYWYNGLVDLDQAVSSSSILTQGWKHIMVGATATDIWGWCSGEYATKAKTAAHTNINFVAKRNFSIGDKFAGGQAFGGDIGNRLAVWTNDARDLRNTIWTNGVSYEGP